MKFKNGILALLALLTTASYAELAPATLSLSPGHAIVVPISKPVKRIATADPEVAETLPIDDKSIYVIAKKTGNTTLILWARDESVPQVMRVQVNRDVAVLQDQIRLLAPDESELTVTASGD